MDEPGAFVMSREEHPMIEFLTQHRMEVAIGIAILVPLAVFVWILLHPEEDR